MNKNKSQSGNILLIIMTVVIVILIGALGFVFWQNYMQTPKATTGTTSTPTSAAITIDDTAAAVLVANFYSEYSSVGNVNKDGDPSLSDQAAVVSKYGTANFVTEYGKFTGQDNAVCAQQYMGPQIVTGHSASDTTAVVTVKELANHNRTTNITVNVVDSSGLKINSITCPAN